MQNVNNTLLKKDHATNSSLQGSTDLRSKLPLPDPSTGVPIYLQIARILEKEIQQGTFSYGEKLPSENEFMRYFDVSRMTVRNALAILFNHHFILSKQGKGTFICYTSALSRGSVDVLIDINESSFSHRYILGISEVLSEKNYNFNFHDTGNNQEVIVKELKKIIQNGTKGVIIEPCNLNAPAKNEMKETLYTLKNSGIPYVLIDHEVENLPGTKVILNDVEGGKIAGDYLISLGHTKCAMLSSLGLLESGYRYRGFCSAFQTLGIPEPQALYLSMLSTEEMISRIVGSRVTGLFCDNDHCAFNAIKALSNVGLRIPEDISVIGYDDTEIANAMTPSLTSIAHPKAGLARLAAEKLIQMITKHSEAAQLSVLMHPELKIRRSCAAPAAGEEKK